MVKKIGKETVPLGYHKPDGGIVIKERFGNKGISFYKCSFCGMTTASGGGLRLEDIVDINQVDAKALTRSPDQANKFVLEMFYIMLNEIFPFEFESTTYTKYGSGGIGETVVLPLWTKFITFANKTAYPAPANLSISGDATISDPADKTFSWDDITGNDTTDAGAIGIYGYRIYRHVCLIDETPPEAISAGHFFTDLTGEDASEIVADATDLAYGMTYTYAISTINDFGYSGPISSTIAFHIEEKPAD